MNRAQDLSFDELETSQRKSSSSDAVLGLASEKVNASVTTKNISNRVGFLQDDEGHNSSMRLMSLVALIAAIMFGILTMRSNSTQARNTDGTMITFSFLIAAFTPKALQKFAEKSKLM